MYRVLSVYVVILLKEFSGKLNNKFINKSNLVKIRRDNMVQALIELDDNTNRVLNIVKAKFGLNDKGEAIKYVVSEYIEFENDPELKPEFIEKIEEIKKQKSIRVDNFAKRYGLN
tara:strand:+ start:79 stop:423 length:345 start_codon:yes stop_codon:yes gene_type:complete